jgi:Flp pilus assembly protein TadD
LAAGIGQHAFPIALGSAALWAVHPLNTEAVTYIIQRSESLMALFVLLTLYCADRSVDSWNPWRWRAAALGALGLALGCKMTGIVAIPLVGLWMWTLRPRTRPVALYLALIVPLAVAALTIGRVTVLRAFYGGWDGPMMPLITRMQYMASECQVVLHYLRLVVWPAGQVFDYAWQPVGGFRDVIPEALFCGWLVLSCGYLVIRRSPWALPLAGALVCLAPTSTLIPMEDLAFEYRMYLPLIGLAAAFVAGLYWIPRWLEARVLVFLVRRAHRAWTDVPAMLLSAVVRRQSALDFSRMCLLAFLVGLLGALAYQRNAMYASDFQIWQDTVRKRPNNPRAHANFGVTLAARDMIVGAVGAFEEAVRLRADYPLAHSNLALCLAHLKEYRQACTSAAQAIALDPKMAEPWNTQGICLLALGMPEQAKNSFDGAIRADPRYPLAYQNRASVAVLQGRQADARRDLATCARLGARVPDELRLAAGLEK